MDTEGGVGAVSWGLGPREAMGLTGMRGLGTPLGLALVVKLVFHGTGDAGEG